MATEKVTVVSCTEKKRGNKNGKDWVIYSLQLEDGRTAETFDKCEPLDIFEAEMTEDPQYGWKLKKPKTNGAGGKFPVKDYTFEKRRVALESAVASIQHVEQVVKRESVIDLANYYYEWLKQS